MPSKDAEVLRDPWSLCVMLYLGYKVDGTMEGLLPHDLCPSEAGKDTGHVLRMDKIC